MVISHQEDSQLVLQYINGDEYALEVLIRKHKRRIYSHIYKIVGDHDETNDFFQETFIKIINTIKLGGYNEEGKFLPWALRIAHNLVIDDLRKEKRMNHVSSLDKDRDIFEFIACDSKNIEEEIITTHVHERLRNLIEMLPPEQKQVIMLRHFSDLSFKEIAEETKVSVNTALGRMRYALLNLRKMMDETQVAQLVNS